MRLYVILPSVVIASLAWCPLLAVLCGCGLEAVRLPLSCPLPCVLFAFACWLWSVVWLACWLEALPPVLVLVLAEAVRLCPVGGYRGRIYQAPKRLYRAHKTPSGAAGRPAGGLFAASIGAALNAGTSSALGLPVSLAGGFSGGRPPVVFWRLPASCRSACGGLSGSPRNATRKRCENASSAAAKVSMRTVSYQETGSSIYPL